MTEFNISNEIVVISTEVENERYVRRRTMGLILQVIDIFDKWYSLQDCDTIYKNISNLLDKAIMPIIREGVKILGDQGVYSIDENIFRSKYLSGCLDDLYEALEIMQDKIDEIENQKQQERNYREARKASRGRVIGGGFGFGGAIKGMATAGVMNATTGMVHSLGNTAGNMGSSIAASLSKSAVYKNSKEPLKEALIQCAFNVQYGIKIALEKEANIKCKYVTVEESNQVEAIINNYRQGRIPEDQRKKLLIQALLLNPYAEETYDAIWDSYGDKNGGLREMSTYFGDTLEQRINEAAEKYGQQLFEKNCSQYVIAFNKQKASIQCEQQIRLTLDKLIQYCNERGISEDTVTNIKKCRHLLNDIDNRIRTVHGITYDTRGLAKSVNSDYERFYEALEGKDIFDQQTYKYVMTREYSTIEFQSIIQNLFEEEQGLRTPERIYENIARLIINNMGNDFANSGWIDVPKNLGNFQIKEATIRAITLMQTTEVPLLLFDRSSNGKSGVLLTNFALRIYSKGIFTNDNQMYPIGLIEAIECIEADKYSICIKGQESVKVSLKQKKLAIEKQIALGETITKIVRLLNNLMPEKRNKLYRILNGVVVCECGTSLLPGEIICPSCKKMLIEDGKFVETQTCPSCNNIVPIGKKYCSKCGHFMNSVSVESVREDEIEIRCPKCSKLIKPGKKFCSYCGTKI